MKYHTGFPQCMLDKYNNKNDLLYISPEFFEAITKQNSLLLD